MPARAFATLTLAAFIAACSSPAATAQPGSTSGAPAASGAAPTAPATTAGTAVDLSNVDVCAIVPVAVAEALTGVSDFKINGSNNASESRCFWGKLGAPQYLEVVVTRGSAPLGDYTLTVNNIKCQAAAVSGIGIEARGGVCPESQNKVWLVVRDERVRVLVQVNEPKEPLTPSDLAAAVTAVLAALG